MTARQKLAQELGVTASRVTQLQRLGCPVERFDDAVDWYTKYIVQKAEKIPDPQPICRSGCVYVLLEESQSALKIGFSANKPEERLAGCQIGNPRKLFLAICRWHNEAKEIERRLHIQFRHCRLSGEWFSASVVEVLKAMDAFDGWKYLPDYCHD